ncbi:hypothetical protein [Roseibium sp. SCP14]|uniref:hypothetical protein n=1 Tax=Roseibium sp. SCP14 TaxID=3141375 RepID=UPI0033385FC0
MKILGYFTGASVLVAIIWLGLSMYMSAQTAERRKEISAFCKDYLAEEKLPKSAKLIQFCQSERLNNMQVAVDFSVVGYCALILEADLATQIFAEKRLTLKEFCD